MVKLCRNRFARGKKKKRTRKMRGIRRGIKRRFCVLRFIPPSTAFKFYAPLLAIVQARSDH